MKRTVVILVLAGCSSTVMMEDPCACVIIPDMDGLVSLAVDGRAVEFDGPSSTLPVAGNLYTVEETLNTTTGESFQAWTDNGLTVSAMDGISFTASWGPDPDFDFTRPGAITEAYYDTDVRADVEWEANESFRLGPQGGTLTLREIAPRAEGGYRVRGSYSAQVCPEESGNCIRLTGTFAFDFADPTLPGIGNAQALVPAG
jgi:hypothetical protein